MRPASQAVRQALKDGAPSVLLAEFDLPGGVERYWSGIGRLDYDGQSWVGIGGVSAISGVASEASAFIQTITFTLAVSDGTRSALSEDLRGRDARVWLGLLDEHAQIIPDPIEIVHVQLDTATISISDGTQQITLTGQTAFYTLEAPSRFLWTNEQQQADFPGDTGWDRAPGNVAKEVTWSPP